MNIKYYYFIDEFNKNEIEKLPAQISLIYRNYHKKLLEKKKQFASKDAEVKDMEPQE